ncbi:ABC transporter substrate-binding protein [Lysinibacter sp. HNR]|uniref:ABC transporter substrate-binding protein n=1 Tax=Lysinibacter sp. HNR TaxID=3031408 RepID=UPI002434B4EF|nr:ABC transporter substrate-binding protein [Lysinibacter sp. HNR]WGD37907.1 ABC transporter substrate-binding protein [Lysinibacter sp. HNR]
MKKKPLLFAALGLATALILSGCAGSGNGATADGSPDPNAVIEIGSLYEPGNLDNTGGGGQGVTEAFSGNVYEGLSRINDDGSQSLLLAESIDRSEDGLTYTATLREGVIFHSGKQLTAADVKSSVERVIAEESKAARKNSFRVISSIETPDESTVVFNLSAPSISFPYLLSYVWVVNSEATDISATEDGTGPYTLGEWRRGNSLSLERFDQYWGEKAQNQEVVFNYFTDATALSNALLTGAVDVVTSIQSPDSLAQFEGNSDYTVSEGTSTTKELLAFNNRVAPFDNTLVRKALYSAIDREKLLDSIWGGHGTLIGSMVPPSDPWYKDLVDVNPYDVDLAKQQLAEAGYADGFEFTLDTPNYDPHPVVAEFVKSELAKVGVIVNINVITADEWYSKVFTERDFEATLQEHVNDRDVVWYGNPDFYWGYNNPEVTQLVTEAEQAASTDEQTEKLIRVNEITAEDAASLWLYLYPQIVVAANNVSGYPVNGLNSQFFVYDIVKN